MPTLPTEEWTTALDRMTAATRPCARATWIVISAEWAPLTDTPAAATTPELLLAWLERRLDQWDARLTAAAELAASVEKQLERARNGAWPVARSLRPLARTRYNEKWTPPPHHRGRLR